MEGTQIVWCPSIPYPANRTPAYRHNIDNKVDRVEFNFVASVYRALENESVLGVELFIAPLRFCSY